MEKSYEEDQYFTFFISAMLSTIILLLLLDYTGIEKTPTKVYAIIIIVSLALILNFYKLRITITKEQLTFGFGLIKNTVNLKDIEKCEVVEIKFRNYLGAGIRYGFDNTLAYNTRFGKAVRIKVKNKKRDYVFTAREPERICKLLKS